MWFCNRIPGWLKIFYFSVLEPGKSKFKALADLAYRFRVGCLFAVNSHGRGVRELSFIRALIPFRYLSPPQAPGPSQWGVGSQYINLQGGHNSECAAC